MSENVSFLINNERFDIRSDILPWSPLLNVMINTDFPVEKIDDMIILNSSLFLNSLRTYFEMLQGTVSMIQEELYEEFYDMLHFMGHVNSCNYPIGAFVFKIIDSFWRDNCKKIDDADKSLIEVPNKKTAEHDYIISCIEIHGLLNESCYIAGSFALNMSGENFVPNDCDIFVDENFDASILKDLKDNYVSASINAINYSIIPDNISMTIPEHSIKVQFVRKKYKNMSDVVYNFDLDCCQYIYDHKTGKLYCTPMGYYSVKTRTNYFDTTRADPSTIYRLIKYACRNFEIFMPFWDEVLWKGIDNKILRQRCKDDKSLWNINWEKYHEVFLDNTNVTIIYMMKNYNIARDDHRTKLSVDYQTGLLVQELFLTSGYYDLTEELFPENRIKNSDEKNKFYPASNDREGFQKWYSRSLHFAGFIDDLGH